MSKLIKALQNDGSVRIRSIIIDDMRDFTLGNEYHPQLQSKVHFFPTFILFPGNLWNNHKTKLKGIIKHGDEPQPKIDYSKNSVLSWINDSLKNSLFSSEKYSSDKYVVPTLGTYNRFKNTRLDENEL